MSKRLDSNKFCADKLGISVTAFQEIRYRFGYKYTLDENQFKIIETTVNDIKKRCDKVTLSRINWYFERYM